MAPWMRVLLVLLVAATCAFAQHSHVTTEKSALSATFEPAPDYPFAARANHITGSGVFVLRIQIKTGAVKQVIVARSTGSALLDNAATQALIKWRFKPGAVPYVEIHSIRLVPPQTKGETFAKVPVTFTM
jgi:TonB family protein